MLEPVWNTCTAEKERGMSMEITSETFMAKDNYYEWMERNKMVCVTIYASDTDLFTEDEINEMVNSVEYYTEMIDIPVPEGLLFQWWLDDLDNNRLYWGKHAWQTGDYEEFQRWFREESTADDTETLYHWLVAHNYNWKRID